MSNSETFCQLLARRRIILNNRNAPSRLEIDNPYTNIDGTAKKDASGNQVTSQRLYERRKAEILQYNKTSTVKGRLTKAELYKQTVESVGRTSNRVTENSDGSVTTFNVSTCASDLYLPTSSSGAGIPGPSFIIQYRPEVPLYGYSFNAQQIVTPSIDSPDVWSFNTINNIHTMNNEWTTLVRIFQNIDNIDEEQVDKDYTFNINIPIGLYITGDISGEYDIDLSLNYVSVNNVEVRILDYGGNVLVLPTITNSFSDVSLNYNIVNSNNFTLLQYIGNLTLDTTLLIKPLSYYEIQLKFNITSSHDNEYVSLLDTIATVVYMNLTPDNISLKNNVATVMPLSNGYTIESSSYEPFNITSQV